MKKQIKKMVAIVLALTLMVTAYLPTFAKEIYAPKYTGSGGLVDGLKAVGIESSFAYRKELAEKWNNIPSYEGSAVQNLEMLRRLREGTLLIGIDEEGNSDTSPDQNTVITTLEDSNVSKADLVATKIAERASVRYIEVVESAPLREGCGKSFGTIVQVESGDCLQLLGAEVNKFGNLWYSVVYGDRTGYIYASHVTEHVHQYETITDDVSVCFCGEYVYVSCKKNTQTSYAAVAGTLLTAEAVFAAGQLAGAGAAITAGLSAAFPVVAIVSVSGLLIYMAVSSSGTQVEDVTYIKSKEDVDEYLKTKYDKRSPYHKACLLPNSATLLMESTGMNLEKAAKYLKDVVNNPAYATFNVIADQTLLNVWCPTLTEATALGERFAKHGPQYFYGSSTTLDCFYEDDQYKYPGKIYFDHYHLWFRSFNSFWKKQDDMHIFFGKPTFAETA